MVTQMSLRSHFDAPFISFLLSYGCYHFDDAIYLRHFSARHAAMRDMMLILRMIELSRAIF